jgi:hypothetical protein
MAAFAAVSLAATAVVLPAAVRAQYRMNVWDCSQFTTSTAFQTCMEYNRTAIDFNQTSQASERQSCLNRIDQARALAARGDMRGWNRVPTRCLY